MNDRPLIVSLLIGLIVVLVVTGVSLLVKMNTLSEVYKKELSRGMTLEKSIEDSKVENAQLQGKILTANEEYSVIKKENMDLKEVVSKLNVRINELETEMLKLEKLKDKLEDNLKEELFEKEIKETKDK